MHQFALSATTNRVLPLQYTTDLYTVNYDLDTHLNDFDDAVQHLIGTASETPTVDLKA